MIKRTLSPSLKILSLLLILICWNTVLEAGNKAAEIDSLMKAYYEKDLFNGSILVADNGSVIYKNGFGFANMEWKIPNTPETKFHIGSITKQFTAMLVLQLVESGTINLNGKVRDYISDYPADQGDRMTIHHLLSHTSGIPHYGGVPGSFSQYSRLSFTPEDFIKIFWDLDLRFKPGTRYGYSSFGYYLLGAILEKVTGKTYSELLNEKIVEPLGMRNTVLDDQRTIYNNLADGYEQTYDGYERTQYLDLTTSFSAGAMISTVEDLYLWDQALYTDQLLSNKLKTLLFEPNLNNHGYGWFIYQMSLGNGRDSVLVQQHGGSITGFVSLITRIPSQKQLIVLCDNASTAQRYDITKGIVNILNEHPFQWPKRFVERSLVEIAISQGVDAALSKYLKLQKSETEQYYKANEYKLNGYGYGFLAKNKTKQAIEVFKLNVLLFPNSANAYDSLGEAYLKKGDTELAIKNYQKSLELNPKNENALEIIKTLSQ